MAKSLGGSVYLSRRSREERERRGCEVCKQWFPHQMLDWHHVDGHGNPGFRRSGIVGRLTTKAALAAEIEKCICVCKNCHAIADYERTST